MRPLRFRALLDLVSVQRYERDRNAVLVRATRFNEFSTEQVIRLLERAPPGRERLSALEILAPRIADPGHRFDVLTAFARHHERRLALEILRGPERTPYGYRAS
jgi:hypothetical protein